MRTILNLFFISIATFIFSGCATSNLSYYNEKLNLQVNDSNLQMQGTQLKQYRENFSTLFLTQKLLRLNDGSIVMYEDARTDMLYEFEPTTARSIDIIFDAKRVIKVYYKAHMYAFQVILQDNRVLNVIVSQGYNQKLKMIYGMRTEKFDMMLKNLDPNATPAYYKNTINLSNETKPTMSRWTTWKVHFVPLVIPIRRLGRV